MEKESEDLPGASRAVDPEVEEAAGLVDAGPLAFWFPGGARRACESARVASLVNRV
jgi:hypothetical protein